MAVNVGALQATLGLNSSQFTAGMVKAESRVSRFSKTATAGLKKFAKVGAVALLATAGLSAKAAATFESSFAGVRKTVDATEEEFAALEKQLRALALTIPVNVNELNAIAEAAGQLGIEKKNIIDFTETMAKLGVTTNLTSDEAATGMARFANITQLPQDQIENLGSVLVGLGNTLATTEKEILDMGLRLAGTGEIIGLTEAETLGLAGALSSVGIRAEAGGTAFSKVLSDIATSVATGGQELNEFAQVAGQTTSDFAKSFQDTPTKAINAFITGLAKIKLEGGNTFGVLEDLDLNNQRVRLSLLNLAGAGDLLGDSFDRSGKLFEKNTALSEEAAKRFETFESNLQLFKNAFIDVGITIGNLILPLLTKLIDFLKPLVTTFGEFVEGVKTGEGEISGSMLKIKETIDTVVKFLKPILLDISKFFVEQFNKISGWVNENMPLIQETIDRTMKLIKQIFDVIWPAILFVVKNTWNVMKAIIGTALNLILGTIKLAMQIFTGDWGGAWETVKQLVVDSFNGLKNILTASLAGFLGLLAGWIDDLKEMFSFSNLKSIIVDGIQKAFDALTNLSLPKIPLPHLSIKGKFDLVPPGLSVPSVGVDWFAKGGVFTAPSIIGVGEKGPEAVIPLSKLGEIGGGGGDTFQIQNVNVNVPDGRVDTFMSELNKQTRTANLRNRVINNGS